MKNDISNYMDQLSLKHIMVLATSSMDKVTARNMSVIYFENCIYFQTDSKMEKSEQIKENKNVALCIDNYQIYGKAYCIGKWDDNEYIKEKYFLVHKASYEKYKNLITEVVYKVDIEIIKIWEYREKFPFIVTIDLKNNTIKEQEYKL
jgi:general stress protein 26